MVSLSVKSALSGHVCNYPAKRKTQLSFFAKVVCYLPKSAPKFHTSDSVPSCAWFVL